MASRLTVASAPASAPPKEIRQRVLDPAASHGWELVAVVHNPTDGTLLHYFSHTAAAGPEPRSFTDADIFVDNR